MTKTLSAVTCIILINASAFGQTRTSKSTSLNHEFSIFSKAVQDSFVISVQLPDDYYKKPKAKYPTVYLLDANFLFPMLAATVKQYEKGGLLPPLILIGIGYKSFK